jgi:hypothetical protein
MIGFSEGEIGVRRSRETGSTKQRSAFVRAEPGSCGRREPEFDAVSVLCAERDVE